MDNMTRPIGDTFRLTEYHPGLPETITTITILEVVENKSMVCKDCYLRRKCMNQPRLKSVVGLCSKMLRKDGKSVVFKKLRTV